MVDLPLAKKQNIKGEKENMDGDDFDLEQFANELTGSGSEPEAAQQGEVHTFEEKYERFVDDMREHILGMGEARLAQIQEEGSQRFSTVLPANVVQNTTIALVGAGGLGNWIWRVLIGMGFRDIAIFDDDVVDTVNIGPQAHNLIDVGMFKVAAIRRQALAFRGIDLQVFPQRVNDLGHICSLLGYVPDIVISAVDNMEFRKRMIDEIVACAWRWVIGTALCTRQKRCVSYRQAMWRARGRL